MNIQNLKYQLKMIIQIRLKLFLVIIQKTIRIIMVNVENMREFLPLHLPPVLRAAPSAVPVISLRTVVVP